MVRYLAVFVCFLYSGCQTKAPAVQGDTAPSATEDTAEAKSSRKSTSTSEDSASSTPEKSSSNDSSSPESNSTESSTDEEPDSIEPVDPVDLPQPLCQALPALPNMDDRTVAHWLTVDAKLLGASELKYNRVDLRLSPERIDLISGRRPIILDLANSSICSYFNPFTQNPSVRDMLHLSGGELLVFFQGGTAVMGRYSKQGTLFQELPRGASGNASTFVKLDANSKRDACIAAEFGDHELQLSFDQGQHWTALPETSHPYNFGALLDRGADYLWTYGMLFMEAMELQWYPTSDLLNPSKSGQILDFGDQWESNTLEAAIAHPHKDATLIVGSGTVRDSGPIVGEIGLDAQGAPVPMRVLWHEGATSPLDSVYALWADPAIPGRLFVGGPTKRAGDAPLLILQDEDLEKTVSFPEDREQYVLKSLKALKEAIPAKKNTLLAGVSVGSEVRLYLIRTK